MRFININQTTKKPETSVTQNYFQPRFIQEKCRKQVNRQVGKSASRQVGKSASRQVGKSASRQILKPNPDNIKVQFFNIEPTPATGKLPMEESNNLKSWKTRGKTIDHLIKELHSFENKQLEVRISVDDGETSFPISLVGTHNGVCLLVFIPD